MLTLIWKVLSNEIPKAMKVLSSEMPKARKVLSSIMPKARKVLRSYKAEGNLVNFKILFSQVK